MVASLVSLLVLAEASSAQPAGPQAGTSSKSSVWQDVHPIISKHKAVFGKPPGQVPTGGAVDGPLLGNGDVGVVLGGAPEAQRFKLRQAYHSTNWYERFLQLVDESWCEREKVGKESPKRRNKWSWEFRSQSRWGVCEV